MNKSIKISGFSLIELMVVISIVGTLLLFSLPLFSSFNLFSNSKGGIDDIVRLINDLKTRAVEQDTDFFLHINADLSTLWVTSDVMDDRARETAETEGINFSKDLSLLDVEFFNFQQLDRAEYQIMFAKQGYSDFALIHIIKGGENITLKIEPFLAHVQIIAKHVSFDDCI